MRSTQDLPSLSWSDVVMFMVSTFIPYTRESIKIVIANAN